LQVNNVFLPWRHPHDPVVVRLRDDAWAIPLRFSSRSPRRLTTSARVACGVAVVAVARELAWFLWAEMQA
jgi:hypothetical protein